MKDKTLWSQPEKKFKPRNKQAAMIVRPALPIHLPPEIIPPPKFAKPLKEILEEEAAERRKRISENEQIEARFKEQERLREEARYTKRKKAKVRKGLHKTMVIRALRAANWQRGLPQPTDDQIAKALQTCGVHIK